MTLKEIAEELNVSPSTVSRVLNGCSKNFTVKPELRARILDQVERSGYKPNRVFSSLRSKENSQISFFFYNRELFQSVNPVSDAVNAIGPELMRRGYSFNFQACGSVQNLYYPLPDWKVAGLIVPDVIYPRQLKNVEAAGLPYVVVNGICGKSGSAIMSDELANARMVMEYLYGLGHRRIGYLDGFVPGNHHYSFNERKRGILDFCEEYRLEPLLSEPWKRAPLEIQFDELLKIGISAVVCYNNEIARQLLYFAWRRGIRIPRDLSVVCFNEAPGNQYTIPPLDTLAVPGREMGVTAARVMVEKLHDPESYRGYSVRIPGKLLCRESSGPFAGTIRRYNKATRSAGGAATAKTKPEPEPEPEEK